MTVASVLGVSEMAGAVDGVDRHLFNVRPPRRDASTSPPVAPPALGRDTARGGGAEVQFKSRLKARRSGLHGPTRTFKRRFLRRRWS
ncbi:hypothetical protein EYF80_052022 [Liparis tanakae]|uniref:Uncharacterized protein n=1 Tax=Liparis tanakae TaxID=230148 RepID=A0A4Z2F9E0_9TELE|nr:hypothetical protein EYF80_052022 [Liparis tanakae]